MKDKYLHIHVAILLMISWNSDYCHCWVQLKSRTISLQGAYHNIVENQRGRNYSPLSYVGGTFGIFPNI